MTTEAPAVRAPVGRSTRLPYLPGLDGLRALAVMSVLLYHAKVSWAGGGFLGVEVFFVISGYLITALLLAEWRDGGRINLGQFWLRRARRLLPALFLVLAATCIIAVVFLPEEVASLRGDVVAALAYVTNWGFIIGEKSYFEQAGRPSLVQHLWSLAVEEQFYLVWPLLFVGGMKFLGRKRFPLFIIGAAVASALLMFILYTPGSDPSRVYYGTDTRAAGILFGCALAFAWVPWRLRADVERQAALSLDAIGAVAVLILAFMLYQTNQTSAFLYRGGLLGLDLVTLVVIAVVVHPAAHLGNVLGIAPLKWIGQRSYGLYLWHWPVFQLTRPGLDIDLDGYALFALRMAITFGLAELSYHYVEMPVRRGAIGKLWKAYRASSEPRRTQLRLQWLAGTAAAVFVVAGLGLIMARADKPAPIDYVALGAGTLDSSPPSTLAPSTVPTTAPVTNSSDVVTTATTTATTTPAPPPLALPAGVSLTAIGDSVMLGAKTALLDLGAEVTVDAAVSRQVNVGLGQLQAYVAGGEAGNTILVGLGNNGTFSSSQFDQIMEAAGGRHVIFLTVRVPRDWMDGNNQVITEGVARYPNASLIDWKTVAEQAEAEGQDIFYKDGMHLMPAGSALYTQLVVNQLRLP